MKGNDDKGEAYGCFECGDNPVIIVGISVLCHLLQEDQYNFGKKFP
jgi:hypothetical protein